jgi:hypothetical protein
MKQKDKNDTNDSENDTNDSDDGARLADFQAQLAKKDGDALRLAENLHTRVYGLRQRAQAAEALIPADDQRVIPAADFDLLAAYKAIGTPDEITENQNALVGLQKFQMVNDAAHVAHMNPKVLSQLLPTEATLEIGEATNEEGQATRVVRLLSEGNEPVLLDRYAETNWTDFLPALNGAGQEQSGKTWIPQQTSKSDAQKSQGNPILERKLEAIKRRSQGKSPLHRGETT